MCLNAILVYYNAIMKKLITLFLLIFSLAGIAQTKDEKMLAIKTYLLSHTVFGNKDSISLEKLFAKQLTYGHSKGKIETREETIRNIIHNTSTYKDTAVTNLKMLINKKTAIVRHLFTAKEIKKDGTIVPLNFTMILVWVKQKKHWRLMGRQAVALPNS
jgi:ketosteroid isomerase-like protein